MHIYHNIHQKPHITIVNHLFSPHMLTTAKQSTKWYNSNYEYNDDVICTSYGGDCPHIGDYCHRIGFNINPFRSSGQYPFIGDCCGPAWDFGEYLESDCRVAPPNLDGNDYTPSCRISNDFGNLFGDTLCHLDSITRTHHRRIIRGPSCHHPTLGWLSSPVFAERITQSLAHHWHGIDHRWVSADRRQRSPTDQRQQPLARQWVSTNRRHQWLGVFFGGA
jgi:hypothetical protein